MYGYDPKDLAATLTHMARVAYERSNCNQVEAKEKFKAFLGNDKRFTAFDPNALAERVWECKSNGAVLDLDDPRLMGGEARPLERRWR